ncbi:hypothetical protein BN1708_001244 [Verticillium longisporum]|uniref:Phospholipid-transporting ATPase n=1 Tax=Verticillium longisporum TaxID=100787 RepID=A0A0G4MN28_VERLO|nr:hypothetical protein BN1708_001244 [Verticillium longisporum]
MGSTVFEVTHTTDLASNREAFRSTAGITTGFQSLYTPGLHPQHLPLLIDAAAEHVSNDTPPEDGLLDDALDVPRLHAPVPDAPARKAMLGAVLRPHTRRHVDDDVAGKLVAANMADEADPRRRRTPLWRPLAAVARSGPLLEPPPLVLLDVALDLPLQDRHAGRVELRLEFAAQHGPRDATPRIPPAMAADEHEDVLHVLHAVQHLAYLERDLELLGVTGVEDKLQKDVKPSLELLRNAGVKIWMLTGDKVETARCVAVSSRLVARGQYIYTVSKLKRKDNAQDHLDFLRSKTDACLLVDGESLLLFLTHFRIEFISVAVQLPTVVACRCSPTQKAEIATLIKEYTKKRVCCIGDGGNDVSMIQAADVGVGIVGKEGRQASLAADFSIEQFHYLTKLLVWHGRNSYKRSAKLAQFVIHRGLIIAVCQTMYSIAIKFEPQGLYKDWLLVGYATVYTAFPVLSLVLDKDVDENLANLYPELYKELTSGRSLSYRTFLIWVLVSVYQGCVIQGLSQILTEVHGPRMVAVSYTVLVLNELLMVAMEITTWHPVMIVSIVGTFMMFAASIPFLGDYFELEFLLTLGFYWRVLAIGAISLIPPYAAKLIGRALKPPSYRKVQST